MGNATPGCSGFMVDSWLLQPNEEDASDIVFTGTFTNGRALGVRVQPVSKTDYERLLAKSVALEVYNGALKRVERLGFRWEEQEPKLIYGAWRNDEGEEVPATANALSPVVDIFRLHSQVPELSARIDPLSWGRVAGVVLAACVYATRTLWQKAAGAQTSRALPEGLVTPLEQVVATKEARPRGRPKSPARGATRGDSKTRKTEAKRPRGRPRKDSKERSLSKDRSKQRSKERGMRLVTQHEALTEDEWLEEAARRKLFLTWKEWRQFEAKPGKAKLDLAITLDNGTRTVLKPGVHSAENYWRGNREKVEKSEEFEEEDGLAVTAAGDRSMLWRNVALMPPVIAE